MPKARLPDGTVLNFPEGIDPAVMDRAVAAHVGANNFSDGNFADDTRSQQLVGGLKADYDSAAQGFKDLLPKNITDRVDAADAWLAKKGIPGFGGGANLQQTVDAGKAYVKNTGPWSTVGSVAAGAVPYAAAAMATGGTALLPHMMTQAATAYGVTPGSANDKDVAARWAAGGQYVGTKLVNTLGRIFRPINPTEEASRLIKQGVYPMPGQSAGGLLKGIEDRATSIPVVGHLLNHGRMQAQKEAVAAAQSKSGVFIKPSEAGQAGFAKIDDSFDTRFSDAKNGLFFDPNEAGFRTAVEDLKRQKMLDERGIREIDNFFSRYKQQPGQLNTILGGDDTHALLQELRKNRAAFDGNKPSVGPYEGRTGEVYRALYDKVDDALGTQGLTAPEKVGAFRDVRRDYANYIPSKKAGEGAVASRNDGLFTSAQFSNQVANNAKRMGNTRQLRQGNAPMQEFGSDWNKVLGDKYPDSGTAGRLATLAAIAKPEYLLSAAIASPFALGASTKVGRKYMSGGYEWMDDIANALRNSKYSGAAGAAAFNQFESEE
jgi:hypothetical protein